VPLAPGVPEVLGGRYDVTNSISLPLSAYCPDRRDFVVSDTLRAGERKIHLAQTKRQKAQQRAIIGFLLLLGSHLPGTLGLLPTIHQKLAEEILANLDAQITVCEHRSLRA